MRFNFFGIARHGHSYNSKLSSKGMQQADKLADIFSLNYMIDADSLLVLSSPAMRAYQTSRIISKRIDENLINGKKHKKMVRLEIASGLWDDFDSPDRMSGKGDIARIYDRLSSILDNCTDRNDVIIVTHNSLTHMIPQYLSRMFTSQNLPFEDLNFGEAYTINFGDIGPFWKHIPSGRVLYQTKRVFY